MADTVAIVPARGGSKGIPRKNLAELGGKPLLAWTITAARAVEEVADVIVSSDDDSILEAAAKYGGRALKRAPALAEDDVHAVDVVIDVVQTLKAQGVLADTVVMLLPTSPFRRSEQIQGALNLHRDHRPPSVVSICMSDKQTIHFRHLGDDNHLRPLLPWDELTQQRQDVPALYVVNGSIYIANASMLLEAKTFHVPGSMGYIMDSLSSLDINEPADLEFAKLVLGTRNGPANMRT